ncbi:hypothetical protein C8R44DRAFT_130296 [Mycena epipterygia]|nr:hypothetical protein C8R44DRAFT_130296 [Mycena epipterygia]
MVSDHGTSKEGRASAKASSEMDPEVEDSIQRGSTLRKQGRRTRDGDERLSFAAPPFEATGDNRAGRANVRCADQSNRVVCQIYYCTFMLHTSRNAIALRQTTAPYLDKPPSIRATPRLFSLPHSPLYLYMAGKPKDVYAASCNPPRSAKQRPRSQSESSSASEYTPEPRRVVPLSPKMSKAGMDRVEAESSTSGAKRGRKPATLSRTAREAQRKLNHSIIEKARRTKINDALATLKQLVPANYGQPSAPADEEDEGPDGEYGGKAAKKPAGKREEKEKEFKLEILIRTVSFMQDLIERVAVLEEESQSTCTNCAGPSSLKRKRPAGADDAEEEIRPVAKRREEGPATPEPSPSIHPNASPAMSYSGARLPSISSWLPDLSQIDPSLRPSPRASPEFQSHLPSPPSSTQFAPSYTPPQLPPALSLGPIATQSLLSARTPEDESAASLLLEISASSPTFREAKDELGLQRQVQTPASLLGLLAKR